MRILKVVLPAAVLAGGMLLCTSQTYGTPAFAKKEKKSCTYCHVKAGQKELNDTGVCYKQDKSLEKCPAPKK